MCASFAFRFGTKSDQASSDFFFAYVKYREDREEAYEEMRLLKYPIFPSLKSYAEQIIKLGNTIEFRIAIGGEANSFDKLMICVFGECGSGKSTTLTKVAEIYASEYEGANGNEPAIFKAKQSHTAVTTSASIKTVGNMKLADTPGTNDA